MRLNTQLIGSNILGYTMVGAFMVGLVKYTQANTFDPIVGGAAMFIFTWYILFYDVFSELFFSDIISHEKTLSKNKMSLRDVYYMLYSVVIYSLITAFLVKYGYLKLEIKSAVEMIVSALVDLHLIVIIIDVFFFRTLHEILHYPANYWTHDVHHKGQDKNLTLYNAWHFGIVDLLFEHAFGPALLLAIRHYMGHQVQIDFIGFLLAVWYNTISHSMNPFTPALFNPVFDYFFLTTICHHMHHNNTKSNFYLIPWIEHLFLGKASKDIEIYNEACGTNVSFNLFIADDLDMRNNEKRAKKN